MSGEIAPAGGCLPSATRRRLPRRMQSLAPHAGGQPRAGSPRHARPHTPATPPRAAGESGGVAQQRRSRRRPPPAVRRCPAATKSSSCERSPDGRSGPDRSGISATVPLRTPSLLARQPAVSTPPPVRLIASPSNAPCCWLPPRHSPPPAETPPPLPLPAQPTRSTATTHRSFVVRNSTPSTAPSSLPPLQLPPPVSRLPPPPDLTSFSAQLDSPSPFHHPSPSSSTPNPTQPNPTTLPLLPSVRLRRLISSVLLNHRFSSKRKKKKKKKPLLLGRVPPFSIRNSPRHYPFHLRSASLLALPTLSQATHPTR